MEHQFDDVHQEDEMKLIVRVVIYDNIVSESSSINTTQQTAHASTDFEAWLSKGGTVSELKAVLESQDLLPSSDSDQFVIEVRLLSNSPPLDDNFCIPESTTLMHLSVLPKLPSSPPAALSPAIITPPFITPRVLPPRKVLEMETSLFIAALRSPFRQRATSSTTTNGATGAVNFGAPTEAASHFLRSPDALQQLMSSRFMRTIMSNPDFLRTLIDSNPQMRELRERNPELNHIFNDPQMLRESMEAMQNPGLMKEMVNNTDRVLRNIDAVPGGFNALRRVYQSIQEPIWDATTGSIGNDVPRKIYDLQTGQGPSTSAIPSPWGKHWCCRLFILSSTATRRAPLPSPRSRSRPASVVLLPATATSPITAMSTTEPVRSTPAVSLPVSVTTLAAPIDTTVDGSQTVESQPSIVSIARYTSPIEPSPSAATPSTTPATLCTDGDNRPQAPGGATEEETVEHQPGSPGQKKQSELSADGSATRMPFPYLYQSVFPSPHRLRSLGGLGMPNGLHIRGVDSTSSQQRPSSSTEQEQQQETNLVLSGSDENLPREHSQAEDHSHNTQQSNSSDEPPEQ